MDSREVLERVGSNIRGGRGNPVSNHGGPIGGNSECVEELVDIVMSVCY